MEHPQDFEPMFQEHIVDNKNYIIVDDCCEGYMRSVSLAMDQWDADALEMSILLSMDGVRSVP